MHTASKPTLHCLRCGYRWTPRGDVPPERIKSCPECKNRKWRERKPPDDTEPRIFENLVNPKCTWQRNEKRNQEPIRTEERGTVAVPTEKPRPQPELHSCYDCGEPADFAIEATDLNFTDRGTEFIVYDEWFCAEHYQERTRNL